MTTPKLKLELDIEILEDGKVARLTHPITQGELLLTCGTPHQLTQTLEFLSAPKNSAPTLTYPEGVRGIAETISFLGEAALKLKHAQPKPRKPYVEVI